MSWRKVLLVLSLGFCVAAASSSSFLESSKLYKYKYTGDCELYLDKSLPRRVCTLYNSSMCLDPNDVFSCWVYDARVRLVFCNLIYFT